MHSILIPLANSMVQDDFIDSLKRRLEGLQSLSTAPNPIIGYPRPSATEARIMDPPARESAVLFPLFRRQGIWHTLFIRRPSGKGVHSGQLSFPGGKLEPGEDHLAAALRETNEEIGVNTASWQTVGTLSTLYIPPSHFVVSPFIAFSDEELDFLPNPDEVGDLIEHPVESFLQPDLVKRREMFVARYNRSFDSGYFDVQGHVLWGATAIMVQEFRSLFGFHN